mmetsp:Transcript_12378/g.31205  ORF Transcript_12378/g.31205 Transcript_12378/m.31205 type:complete len:375 (-) Transcript_12378:84-1208(-)
MVLCVGIVIQDTRPDHCSTNFGFHGDSKTTKVGPASLLDIIEIQKDCYNTGALKPIIVERNEVVMIGIPLCFFVSKQLEKFRIVIRDSGNVFHACQNGLCGLVLVALVEAPRVVRGSRFVDLAPKRPIEFNLSDVLAAGVAPIGSQLDQFGALFLGRDIVQCNHPRALGGFAVNFRREFLDIVGILCQTFKHFVQIAGTPRFGGIPIKGTPVLKGYLVARLARRSALQGHVSGINVAFSNGSPKRARAVVHLALISIVLGRIVLEQFFHVLMRRSQRLEGFLVHIGIGRIHQLSFSIVFGNDQFDRFCKLSVMPHCLVEGFKAFSVWETQVKIVIVLLLTALAGSIGTAGFLLPCHRLSKEEKKCKWCLHCTIQ